MGAEPAFVDVDRVTLLMDPDRLAEALRAISNVKAVIVTHLYGLVANVARLVEIAHSSGVPAIEDCAQCHGASIDGRRAGSFADLGCFSFFPTKNLGALGDGGAVITDREDHARSIRSLRQYGWTQKYHAHQPGGRNSRLDEMQAAVLRLKLARLDGWNATRRAIAARLLWSYYRAVKSREGVLIQPANPPAAKNKIAARKTAPAKKRGKNG